MYFVTFILKNLTRRPVRTALTVLGLSVAIGSMVALWTLIILPNAGIAPRRRPPRSRIRVVVSVVVFNILYFAIWLAQREGRGWFHAR